MNLKRPLTTGLVLQLTTVIVLLASTATAHAGEFRIWGSTFTAEGVSSESFGGGFISASKFLVPGLSLTIECTSGTTGFGTARLGGTAEANLTFTGCKVAGNKFCTVYPSQKDKEVGTRPGEVDVSLLGSLVLREGKHYVLLQGPTIKIGGVEISSVLSQIFYTSSAKGCTLSSGEPVSGSTVASLPGALTWQANQEVASLSQAELEASFSFDKLSYGNQTAWLDGATGTVKMTGANAGQLWSGE